MVPDDPRLEPDPEGAMSALVERLHGEYIANVQDTGGEQPVCEEPSPSHGYEDDSEPREFVDDISGKSLDSDLVERARREEMEIIQDMGVWKVVDRPMGKKVIGTRWVDINKGAEVNPD